MTKSKLSTLERRLDETTQLMLVLKDGPNLPPATPTTPPPPEMLPGIKCETCPRMFKTQSAMHQHSVDKHDGQAKGIVDLFPESAFAADEKKAVKMGAPSDFQPRAGPSNVKPPLQKRSSQNSKSTSSTSKKGRNHSPNQEILKLLQTMMVQMGNISGSLQQSTPGPQPAVKRPSVPS